MGTLLTLIGLCLLLPTGESMPRFLLTAPNIIHVGVPQSVTVHIAQAEQPVTVTVYFQNQLAMSHQEQCSSEVTFTLNQENDFKEVKQISLDRFEHCRLLEQRKTPYIHLVAESPDLFQGKRRLNVLWSSRKGYIFIQTDKPIYTPSETVRFRIFMMDHVMRPVVDTVTINVFNSQGAQVKKNNLAGSSVMKDMVTIPDIAESGTWKIEAWFQNAPMSNATAEFQVKKFTLPGFEVKVTPQNPYFHINEDTVFHFQVTAMHTYGEGVNGIAYLRFGVVDFSGTKMLLKGLEQQVSVVEGQAKTNLTMQKLISKLNTPLKDLVGSRLYIAVTVIETASGELQETELSSVMIVSSPYLVDLSKTKHYFEPGTSFSVLTRVTLTDNSPVMGKLVTASMKINGKDNIKVEKGTTDSSGRVTIPVNTPVDATSLDISVSVGEGTSVSMASTTAKLQKSATNSYLFIQAVPTVIKAGDPLTVTLKEILPPGSDNVTDFYYMVLNKGQTLRLEKVQRISYTTFQLQVTEDMIPAFRLVAYFFAGSGGKTELVANSVWVDVVDACRGKLEVKPTDQRVRHPGDPVSFQINTDDEVSVSLVAVDAAVYALNRKNKLTQANVFEAMNSYDLGCTVGGGEDVNGVFHDAGLAFITNEDNSTLRKGYGCEMESQRQKRSATFKMKALEKANEFKDPKLQKCCKDGMTLLRMKRTCQQRANRIKEAGCRDVFLSCCEFATELRKNLVKKPKRLPGLARAIYGDEEGDDDFDDSFILTRTHFPQSWMWKTLDVKDKQKISEHLPDSITTWEIQAVGLFKNKGFCVPDPVPLKVFKEFHISLRLPYSVKRFEQLEVKAVLYNYLTESLQLTVYLKEAEGLCSAASEKRQVTVRELSALPVYFSVVPTKLQNVPIHVVAYDQHDRGDSISKVLRVVAEGVTRVEEKTYSVNPEVGVARSFMIDADLPSNLIPETSPHLFMRFTGEVLGDVLKNSLSAEGINQLIRLPTGCGEQTMIIMAPTVYALEYMDHTEQWLGLNLERKEEAVKFIQSGYTRILEFKKKDGSFAAWPTYRSSTWLTAFVLKVLTQVRQHISVDEEHIKEAVLYLLDKQWVNGMFHDRAPVIHREMQGGVGGVDGDASLTAFVTIALQSVLNAYKEFPQLKEVEKGIGKAMAFFYDKMKTLKRPYAIAITAYALALARPDSHADREATQLLRNQAKFDKEKAILYWEADDSLRLTGEEKAHLVPRSSAISVETTAYGLLHALLKNDISYANPIVRWLTEQQNYGGGFYSTQDTVVALEALSQYQIKTFGGEGTSLRITLSSPGRNLNQKLTLQKSTAQLQEEMKILKVYNTMDVDNSTCNLLKMEVTMRRERDNNGGQPGDADYEYEYDYASDQPQGALTGIRWFDLRNGHRSKRRAPTANSKEVTVTYQVCTWHEWGAELSGMAIVDISLLSGVEPDTSDLDKLKDLSDRYISHYELKDGRLLLYFDKVTSAKECIEFGATQLFTVGLMQPASATLYDYYEPEKKCTVFYGAPDRSSVVSTLCSGDVCQCAEGQYQRLKKTFDAKPEITEHTRTSHACYHPIVDYAYIVTVIRSSEQSNFKIYECSISKLLRATADSLLKKDDVRHFIKRKSCPLHLDTGKDYLFMGKDGKIKDVENRIQYLLDSDTWIEEIPSKRKCEGSRFRKPCRELNAFLDKYQLGGCHL
nr:PREDICTED: complement C4-like [Latimeria chalumnae]|eukprot:XP_014347018.1 PREDICTED: complement C4-like [Latimeria chalumnae]